MNNKVIELPNWEEQRKSQTQCILEQQAVVNHISKCHFKKLWRTNLKIWLAIGFLLGVIAFQQYQICSISKGQQKVIVVDNQTDLSGIDAVPPQFEELK